MEKEKNVDTKKPEEKNISNETPIQNETVMQPITMQVQPVAQPIQEGNLPEEYRPISMWGYLGYQILFAIPCVGFILILVFSFGGSRNINLRNFARAYLLAFVIGLVLVGIIIAIFGVAFFSAANSGSFESIG